jgi:hypothetical protein
MDIQATLSEATAGPGHNSQGKKVKALLADVDNLGKESARGTTALSDLAMRVVEAACDGVITPKDAKPIYERYATASKKAGGTPGSIKTTVSKIRKLIEIGGQNDGMQLADDVVRMRGEVDNAKPPFDGLVDDARLRLKEKRRLNDDEIKTALAKAPKREKAKPAPKGDVVAEFEKLVAAATEAELIAIRDRLNQRIC